MRINKFLDCCTNQYQAKYHKIKIKHKRFKLDTKKLNKETNLKNGMKDRIYGINLKRDLYLQLKLKK